MNVHVVSLISLALVGCAAGADKPSAEVAASTSAVGQLSPDAAAAAGALVFKYPPSWDAAVEVPFVRAEPDPEVRVAVEEAMDEVIDLAVPIELGDGVLFASGTAVITGEADAVLQRLAGAAVAQLGEGQSLEVHGYVDEVGTPEFNEWLGDERAAAVVNRLVRHQPMLDGRVVGIGHGEDDLLDPACRGDCPSNRKVIVQVAE